MRDEAQPSALGAHAYLAIVLLAVGIGVVVLVGVKAARTVGAALQAQRDLQGAVVVAAALTEGVLSPAGVRAAAAALPAAVRSLEALAEEIAPLEPVLGAARGLPQRVSWVADAPEALRAGIALGRAASLAAGPVAAALPSGDDEPMLLRAIGGVGALAEVAPQLDAELERASRSLAQLRGRSLGGPLSRLEPMVPELERALPAIRLALRAVPAMGPAVGLAGTRRYLVVGQNNYELRATGGFIGSAGVATLQDGQLADLAYGSSYTVDADARAPAAPIPMQRYLGLGAWYLRDANWWPDFPASAAQLETAWLRAGQPAVDGVIAFDMTAVVSLLRAVGPIEVAGYGPVTPESFERQASLELYSPEAVTGPAAFHAAKSAFLAPVARALVQRLLTVRPTELPILARELARLADEKHLQLALKDPVLADLVHSLGWAGAIPSIREDSLYAVDTTVSYGDTHRFIKTEAALSVVIDGSARRTNQLTLTYSNGFPEGLPEWLPLPMVEGGTFDPAAGKVIDIPGFWGDWLRVYLPPTATVIDLGGLQDVVPVAQEFGRTVVAGYLPLRPGDSQRVTLRYTTEEPPGSDGKSYRLFLEKQAGIDCRSLSVSVRWPTGVGSYDGCSKADAWIELRPGVSGVRELAPAFLPQR
jgi:hypothetical protein